MGLFGKPHTETDFEDRLKKLEDIVEAHRAVMRFLNGSIVKDIKDFQKIINALCEEVGLKVTYLPDPNNELHVIVDRIKKNKKCSKCNQEIPLTEGKK